MTGGITGPIGTTPQTIFDATVDGGACQIFSVKNVAGITGGGDWAMVTVSGLQVGVDKFPIAVGDEFSFRVGLNVNGITKVTVAASTSDCIVSCGVVARI